MTGSSHCTTRRGTVAAVALLTATGAALGATPASASSSTVTDGKNITVVHSNDIVMVSGYGAGAHTVDVLRDGVVVGTETALPYDVEGAAGLEVNHGVDGPPRDGDCWDKAPDIKPGDTVQVTAGGVVQKVVVDDISLISTTSTDTEVLVRGVAKYADGTAIPLSRLDNNAFRNVGGKFRADARAVTAWPERAGGFQLHYPKSGFTRNSNGLSLDQRVTALLEEDGHATGYGHVDGASEAQFVEGFAPYKGVIGDGCPGGPVDPDEPAGPPAPPPPPPATPADKVAPKLNAFSPAGGTRKYSRNTNATATFNEKVKSVSGASFTLTLAGKAVAAKVTYNADTRKATLNPVRRLQANTKYTVTLTSGITDLAGNTYPGKTWTFTTKKN